MDTDLSLRETAARALFEVIPPTHRHDGSDVTWHEATVSPWAGHWTREVEIARRRADAVLAAVAAHDGLADVLRACAKWGYGPGGNFCHKHGWVGDGWAAHLADVVRAWMVQP